MRTEPNDNGRKSPAVVDGISTAVAKRAVARTEYVRRNGRRHRDQEREYDHDKTLDDPDVPHAADRAGDVEHRRVDEKDEAHCRVKCGKEFKE
jgi:hypothetical protein